MNEKWCSTKNYDYDYFRNVPCVGGVYVIFLSFKKIPLRLSYIGSSGNLRKRLMHHRMHNYARYSTIIECVFGKAHEVTIKYKVVQEEVEWKANEVRLIKRLRPLYNKAHNG